MALNVGIVGCGDIALKNYLPGTRALAGTVDVVATCDPRYDRAVRAGEEFGAEECRAYASLDELLRDPQVEGVEILTPGPCTTPWPCRPCRPASTSTSRSRWRRPWSRPTAWWRRPAGGAWCWRRRPPTCSAPPCSGSRP